MSKGREEVGGGRGAGARCPGAGGPEAGADIIRGVRAVPLAASRRPGCSSSPDGTFSHDEYTLLPSQFNNCFHRLKTKMQRKNREEPEIWTDISAFFSVPVCIRGHRYFKALKR